MMNKALTLILTLAAQLGANAWAMPANPASPALLACGDDQIRVLRIDGAQADEVWRWTAAQAPGLTDEWRKGLLAHIDDCKSVDGGRAVLATSSTGGTVLIDRSSGRTLFQAHTPMAHSADLLPGGLIAVALSVHDQGNRLQIYRRDGSDKVLAEMPLRSGHGAVWDVRRALLFVLSHDSVQSLAIHDSGNRIEIEQKGQWTLPGKRDGHDLSLRPDGSFFVTTHDGAWIFDPGSGAFTAFDHLNPVTDVKAISQSGDSVAWMQAEESWWAHGFSIWQIKSRTLQRYRLTGIALYKVRWDQ